jgi:hypothetical protein
MFAQYVRWLPSGTEILVSGIWGEERTEVRRVLLADGRVSPLEPAFSFGSGESSGQFAVSSDGRLLAYVRIEARGDLWLLEAKPGNY